MSKTNIKNRINLIKNKKKNKKNNNENKNEKKMEKMSWLSPQEALV